MVIGLVNKIYNDMSLLESFPKICQEWDYEKNKKLPSEYLPYSNKRVSWVCKYGHKWDAIISNRTRQNNNCPVCYKNESWCENYIFLVLSQVYDVRKLKNPEIDIYIPELNVGIEYESRIRNYDIPKDIVNTWSNNNSIEIEKCLKTHKYKWICDKCNSEYESSLRDRLKGMSCPFCASQKVNSTNSLASTHPHLLKYISPYNEIDPSKVTYGTGKKLKFIFNSKEYNDTPRNFSRYIK